MMSLVLFELLSSQTTVACPAVTEPEVLPWLTAMTGALSSSVPPPPPPALLIPPTAKFRPPSVEVKRSIWLFWLNGEAVSWSVDATM